jgi:type VI secretion system protein
MSLKLTITSAQRTELGAGASVVFGADGGSIGRSHDNDWVLPDPKRYLSAHHARVQYRRGAFHLLDTSSNGVFINDANVPLGRLATYPLRDGDRLRLGDYELKVSLAPDRTDATEASAVFPVTRESSSVSSDIGASFSLRELLMTDASGNGSGGSGSGSGNRLAPVDAYGQTVTEDSAMIAFDQSDAPPPPLRAVASIAPAPLRRDARTDRGAVDGQTSIEAFCRGAGIDPGRWPADTQARVLQLAGLLLREAVVGIKALVLAQRELRVQANVEFGRDSAYEGLTALPVEELLRRMLDQERRDLDAVQWLRDMLGSARRHDAATMRALSGALLEFTARLDPRSLTQEHPDELPLSEPVPSGLTARFRSITESSGGKLPHLFSEAFARIFAAEFSVQNGDGKS